MKLIRKRALCLCEGINLVLVTPTARGIIHEPSISHFPPTGMKNTTLSQEQAFTLQLHRAWQNRVVIMWNYWYKHTDEWVLHWLCICAFLCDVYVLRMVFAWLPDRVEQVTLLKHKGCLPLREWVRVKRVGLCLRNFGVQGCGFGSSIYKFVLNKYHFIAGPLFQKSNVIP